MNQRAKNLVTGLLIVLCVAYLGIKSVLKSENTKSIDISSGAPTNSGSTAQSRSQAVLKTDIDSRSGSKAEATTTSEPANKQVEASIHQPASNTVLSNSEIDLRLNDVRALTRENLEKIKIKVGAADIHIGELKAELLQTVKNREQMATSAKKLETVLRTLPEERDAKSDRNSHDVASTASQRSPSSVPTTTVKPVDSDANSSVKNVVGLLSELNSKSAEPLAKATVTDDHQTQISINGDALLLTDHNRPRVSQNQFLRLKPLVYHLSQKQVDPIILRVSSSVPASHVDAILKFVRRQYGWQVKVETSQLSGRQVFPLQLEITSR